MGRDCPTSPLPTVAGLPHTGGSYIYETTDHGVSWRVLATAPSGAWVEDFDTDASDPDLLWIAWSDAVVRLRRRLPAASLIEPKEPWPEVSKVVLAALRATKLDTDSNLAYRQRARLAPFMPALSASYQQRGLHTFQNLADGLYLSLPYRRLEALSTYGHDLRFILTWDLSDIIFRSEAQLAGRTARMAHDLSLTLRREIAHAYGEVLRLRGQLALGRELDLRTRVHYRLRVDELVSYINQLTDGYLTKWHSSSGT